MPGVVIISETEKLSKVIDGATFYYRRVPGPARDRIYRASTSKRTGIMDAGAHLRLLLAEGLIGWTNVLDAAGKQLPFSVDIIPYLPDTVQAELSDAMAANTEKVTEVEIPNLPVTQSSNS